MRLLLISAAVLALAACQPAGDEAPGDLPADAPLTTPVEDQSPAADTPVEPEPAQTQSPAYVGFWVAELDWCSNTVGPEQPLEITETTFYGYENHCEITQVEPSDEGWSATFVCEAEGETSSHPVGIEADARHLEITWIDEGYSVDWRRCPA